MSEAQNTQPAASTSKPFMHMSDACAWLGFSERQGLYEVKAGRLKVFWITRHPHVLVSDLHAYVEARVKEADAVRHRREEKRTARAQRLAERRALKNQMAACPA